MPNGSWQAGLGAAVAAAGPAAFAWRCTAAALLGLDAFTPGEAGFAREPEVAVTYPQVGKRSCATGV
ncbi:MAG TPA: hypothetical protein VFP61_03625, partial [Acidimicrobiales bacterium]|nr:hypothetical protein [Acidimicrobiales bacterium]